MKTKYLIEASVIAAVYAVLTVVLSPISYGMMQVRISEALTVLPFFTPAAIPGLFVGCLVSNLLSPYGVPDLVCGSLAALIAAIASYILRNRPILVPLPPVLANGVIVGAMLYYVYAVPVSLPLSMLWVAAGQLIACYGIGYPLMKYLKRYKGIFQ